MALTPVEIRHIRLHKGLFGYQPRQTDELLADIVNSFEDVWRDRADLADKIEQLEAELIRYRELEQLLRTTLISAERASQQMTDQTRRESEAVLSDARAEAREIVREALSERERLNAEIERIRAQLVAVLRTLGDEEPGGGGRSSAESTLETPPQSAPPPVPPQASAPVRPQAVAGPPHPAATPAEPIAPSQWPTPAARPPGPPRERPERQVLTGAPANGMIAPVSS
jgi:cell division initiation protein